MRRLLIPLALLLGLLCAASAQAATVFVISGGGFGHGIGMSQYGAAGYAEHGKDYRYILGHYYSGTSLATVRPGAAVRVLLGVGNAAFSGASQVGSTRLNPSLTYAVKPQSDGTLQLVGPNGKPVGPRYQSPLGVTSDQPLTVAGLGRYRGALEFRVVGSHVQTVNVVGLDDYVRGVVAAEMPSSWPAQALEVQAVAARTYALTASVSGNGYSLYSDTRSQMYGGVRAETPATNAAVAATLGQVVTYHGSPVTTYFSSSSGGHTENVENVWSGASVSPWLRGVADPYDNANGNPYYRWTVTMTPRAAAAKLGHYLKGSFLGVRVLRRGVSQRVMTAEVLGSRGTTPIDGATLERTFGLESTLATFATISTAALPSGSAPALHLPAHAHWLPTRVATAAVMAVVPRLGRAAAAVPNQLHGSVLPGRAGDAVTIQVSEQGHWRTVAHTRLGGGGTFTAPLTRAGAYRILYRGVSGPTVTVR